MKDADRIYEFRMMSYECGVKKEYPVGCWA
jgi:hypothetical protein